MGAGLFDRAVSQTCVTDFSGDGPEDGKCDQELQPWYASLAASIGSHVGGILGFLGFQKIVVARRSSSKRKQQ